MEKHACLFIYFTSMEKKKEKLFWSTLGLTYELMNYRD